MNTPEARLSAAERAALADLESAASAADPSFAARLRGRAPSRSLPLLLAVRVRAARAWERAVGLGWWSIPVTITGLFLVVLGVPYGFPISVLGLVVSILGLRMLAELVDRRWLSPASSRSASDS